MCDTFNKKHVCPRLFDYFVIVGNNKPSGHNKIVVPKLLRKYPAKDHKDFILPANIVYFCQPEGCIQNLVKKNNSFQRSTNNAFIFALTDKDTNRVRYGICVNFYRQIEHKHNSQTEINNSTKLKEKVLNEVSNNKNPFLNFEENNLLEQDIQSNFPLENPRPESSISNNHGSRSSHRHRTTYYNSLTSLCLISHHPFFSSFRECLFTIKNLIERCNIKNAKPNYDRNNNEFDNNNSSKSAKKDVIWCFLTGEKSLNLNNDALIKEDLKQIENFIMRILSAPVPIPGRTKIEIELLKLEKITNLVFAYSEHTRFSLVDFPLHLPLELLGVNCCIQVLTCILLEHKVILQSSNYNALCISVMAFVAMLYPLDYMFPVIPLLPTSLDSAEQLLLAPTPYIIGIPASFLKIREKSFSLPNDVWLVDLDANRLIKPEGLEDLPPLPEPENTMLVNQFKSALQIMSSNASNKSLKSQQAVFENDIDCVDIAVRVAMINFFNSSNMLANFTEHTRTIKLYPRPVVAVQINSFLQSRPKNSQFLSKFIKTQAVEYYAEYVLNPSNVAFLRVQTGVCSPQIVGDKVKWFNDTLEPISFKAWTACSSSFLSGLLNQNNYNTSELEHNSENEEYSSEELSQSSSCSSLTNFTNDLFTNETSSFNLGQKNEEVIQQFFCDENIYNPPKGFKLSNDNDDTIELDEKLKNDSEKFTNNLAERSLSKTDNTINDHSSQYSSNSSLSSLSSLDSNTELKLFDTSINEEESSKQNNMMNINLTGIGEVSNINKLKQEEIILKNDYSKKNEFSFLSTTASSSTSTTSSTATIIASPLSQKQNLINNNSQKLLKSETNKPLQRPNSTSGSSSVKTTTPHKFHSLDSNVENQEKKSIEQLDDLLKQKSYQKHSASLDQTSSTTVNKFESNSIDKTESNCSSPVLSRTISNTSVFSKTGSIINSTQNIENNLHRDKETLNSLKQTQNQKYNQPHIQQAANFLDRFTKEAKGFTRDALQATKNEVEGRKTNILKSLNVFNNDIPNNTDLNISTQQSQNNEPHNSKANNNFLGDKLASNLSANLDRFEFSSEINGLADKTSSVLSGFFSGKMVDKVKEKVQQQQFHQFPKTKDLIEKKIINKTPLNNNQYQKESLKTNLNTITTKKTTSKLQHNENQNFLQGIIDNVLAGEGIGWLKFNRIKNLMEDENYRNFVVSRLNKKMDRKLGPDDFIQDVEISKAVWKGMLKLLVAIIHGIEHTYLHNGLGGMQSTLVVLEIAHTHYWIKESNEDHSITNDTSTSTTNPKVTNNINSMVTTAATSPFGSNENLSIMSSTRIEINDHAQSSSHQVSNAAFETIMAEKKQNLINPGLKRLESVESEVSDLSTTTSSSINTTATNTNCNVSDTGSLTVNPVYMNRLGQVSTNRSTYSDSELDGMNYNRQSRAPSIWSSKSSISTGMPYGPVNLLNTSLTDVKRTYLFQGLIGKDRSSIWNESQFWEDMFLDAISQEREIIGLDQGAGEMIERYQSLNEAEKKRLEHEEDRLITNLLHNMVAFMVMLKVNPQLICRKIRRLLGRCHIGVIYSDEINLLIQHIEHLQGNDIDLKCSANRQAHKQTFTLYIVSDKDETNEKDFNNNLKNKLSKSFFNSSNIEQMCFMEVRDDGLILRSINGTILERWWYERIVNMTYCPKNKTLCLWRRTEGQTHLHKYRSKKSKDLYYCIKQAMDKAASRTNGPPPGTELGGEFPVQDLTTGEGGLILVCMGGVGLLFACSKDFEFFVKLENIRKCYAQKGGIFVLEEFNPKTRSIIERKYKTKMSDQICYAVLCVFSYMAAGSNDNKKITSQVKQNKL